MNDLAVRDLIEKFGTTPIAKALGLPVSTVHTWKRANAILGAPKPGDPPSIVYQAKIAAFQTAIKQLSKARKPRRRSA